LQNITTKLNKTMKKQLLFVCLFLFCALGKAQIIVHVSEIEKFHNLMRHIEKKAGGELRCERGNELQLQAAFERNSKDSTLNALIDNLVNSMVSYYGRLGLRHVSVNNFSEEIPRAREAYRVAFTVLPNFCVDLVGGRPNKPELWVEYWNDIEHRKRIENAVIELSASMEEIVESMTSDLKALLPRDVEMDVEMNIHLITHGDGAFFFGNNIVMDLLCESFANFSNFFATLTHEVHHVFYGNWLWGRFANKERNQGERYLFSYQMRFILEGTASFYEIPLLPSELKQMKANRELNAELLDEFILIMRGLAGDNPQYYYWEVFRDYLGERSFEWQKRFWPGDPDSIIQGFRPTVIYYLSFNIYNLIYESGGHEKLKFVIENPAKLLSVFNELHTECMIVPRVPDDIVLLWKNNLTP